MSSFAHPQVFTLSLSIAPSFSLAHMSAHAADDVTIIAARLAFACTMFFTYPLEAYVVRHVVEELWGFIRTRPDRPRPRFSWLRHFGITIVEVVLATLLAILVGDNLGVVLELVGTTNAVALSLVLPSLVYLKVEPGRIWQWRKVPVLAMLGFGVADGIASTALIISHIAGG